MTLYIFTWRRDDKVPRQKILDFLDTLTEVSDWHASTGAIFFRSTLSGNELTDKFHAQFPDLFFAIAQVSIETVDGWTSKPAWEFIRAPRKK
jgi:hypothetical protein